MDRLQIDPLPTRDIQGVLLRALQDHILRGDLKAGDRIPPERELAEMLNVSRGALREALTSLRAVGLIAVVPGRGTILAQNPHGALAHIAHSSWLLTETGIRNLVEVRMIIEESSAQFAAERRTSETVEALNSALDDLVASSADPEEYVRRDIGFHILIADSTGNTALAGLLSPLTDLLLELSRQVLNLPNRVEQADREHREIVDAIAAGDGQRARRGVREHLRVYLASAHLAESMKTLPRSRAAERGPT